MEPALEGLLRLTLKPGSVYYFPDASLNSRESHYFIVINMDPLTEEVLFLVCASSRIEAVKRRNRNLPSTTLVEITPDEYPDFTKDSIIDCNNVFQKSIVELAEKFASDELHFKAWMDIALVEKLRQATLASPLVENRIKQKLRKSDHKDIDFLQR